MNLLSPDSDDMRRDQLEAILNNAVDAIITIDDRGLIVGANPATEKMFGYDLSEVLGQNIKILMPTAYQEEHDGSLANYLRTGEKKVIGIGREVVGKRKDGTVFPIHVAVSEIHVGGRTMFTGIVRDISDLKEAEHRLERMKEQLKERVRQRTEELRVAQAELLKKEKLATLGQISGSIGHEIRNPLNTLKISTFFLLNANNPSQEKIQEHLDRIDRQVTIIDNIVTALSDVAKLPAAKRQPVSIAECIRQVLKSTSLAPNIDVDLQVTSGVPHVLVDELQIPIVFRNLIRNARDAMPDGGKLIVNIFPAVNYVTVEVIDHGHGITPEDLERVTEPLFSTKARGMGLGLAISQAILDKNRGKLIIQSEVGKGSTFRVDLQVASDDD